MDLIVSIVTSENMALHDHEMHLVQWMEKAKIQQPENMMVMLHKNNIFSLLQLLQSEKVQNIVRNSMTIISCKHFDTALRQSIQNHQPKSVSVIDSVDVSVASPRTVINIDGLLANDIDPIIDTEKRSTVADLDRQVLLETFFIEYAIHLKCSEPVGCFTSGLYGEAASKNVRYNSDYVYEFSRCAHEKLTKSIEAHQERAKRLIELIDSRKGTGEGRLKSSKVGWTRRRSAKRAKKVAFDTFVVPISSEAWAVVPETEKVAKSPPDSALISEVPIAELRRLERIRLNALKNATSEPTNTGSASNAEVEIQELRRQEKARLKALSDRSSAGQWQCEHCKMMNKQDTLKCCACLGRRDLHSPSQQVGYYDNHERDSTQRADSTSEPTKAKFVERSAISTNQTVVAVPTPPPRRTIVYYDKWPRGCCLAIDIRGDQEGADLDQPQRQIPHVHDRSSTVQEGESSRAAKPSPSASAATVPNRAYITTRPRAAIPSQRTEHYASAPNQESALRSNHVNDSTRHHTLTSDGTQLQPEAPRLRDLDGIYRQEIRNQAVTKSDAGRDVYANNTAPAVTYRGVASASGQADNRCGDNRFEARPFVPVRPPSPYQRPGQQPVSSASYLAAANRACGGSVLRPLPEMTHKSSGITLVSVAAPAASVATGGGGVVGDCLPQRVRYARSDIQPQQQQHQQSEIRHSRSWGGDRAVSVSGRTSTSSLPLSSLRTQPKQQQKQHSADKPRWR